MSVFAIGLGFAPRMGVLQLECGYCNVGFANLECEFRSFGMWVLLLICGYCNWNVNFATENVVCSTTTGTVVNLRSGSGDPHRLEARRQVTSTVRVHGDGGAGACAHATPPIPRQPLAIRRAEAGESRAHQPHLRPLARLLLIIDRHTLTHPPLRRHDFIFM